MRGFKDNLPPTSQKFNYINQIFKEFSNKYGTELIELNYVEESNLYYRTSGEKSEICNKELFEVRKFNGKYEGWALRPEGTASCIRMIKDNNYLDERKFARFGYYGAMFRYNRPQKGRYRQFIQAGWEWLGSEHKYTDYEIILAACEILNKLNIYYTLEINTIGNIKDRQQYRTILSQYLKTTNEDPLKILDKMNDTTNIPKIQINQKDQEIFEFIIDKLKKNNINYKYNPYLVRGLDYYNGIVFEFKHQDQTILAGGRYDQLMSQLDGPYTPAIGFAMGVDRIVEILDYTYNNSNEYALISLNADDYAMKILQKLRSKNKKCTPYWGQTLSKGLKLISKYYKYVIIVGENEKANNTYILKDLETSKQETISLD